MSRIARGRFLQRGGALTFFGPSAAVVYLPLGTPETGNWYCNRVSAQSALYMAAYNTPTTRGGIFHGAAPYFNSTNYYYTQQTGFTVGASDAHTVSVWISGEAANGYKRFFFEGSYPRWDLAFYARGDQYGKPIIYLEVGDNTNSNIINASFSAVSSSSVAGNDINGVIWHHILYTQVGLSERHVYLNGDWLGVNTTTVGARSYTNMVIGADCTNGPNNAPVYESFNGRMQELLTLRRSVGRYEVKAYYEWCKSQFMRQDTPKIYGFDYTYALREAYTHDQKLAETLDLTETVRTHHPVFTQAIREEMLLEDSIGRTERMPSEQMTLGDTYTETLDDADTWTLGGSTGFGTSTFGLILFMTPRELQLRVLAASDVHPVPSTTLEQTIWYSPFIRQNIFFEIERLKAWMESTTLSFQIAKPMFMVKNFEGTAYHMELDIIGSVSTGKRLITDLLEDMQPVFYSKKLIYSILPNPTITAIAVEYKILLDGVDVTSKIASCTVTYSKGSYVGEIDVTWADYSVYSDVDCSNINKNYMLERLEVYSRLLSNDNPTWTLQGKFFIEKRGTSVAYDSIVPTSWGRTRPAVLAMPYAKPLTKMWEEDTTALSVAQELCDAADLPVVLSWEIADYKILGSNLDVEGTEPIEIISTLAATLGGELTTTRDGTLRVVYKYPVSGQASVNAPQVPDAPMLLQVIAGEGQATVYFI